MNTIWLHLSILSNIIYHDELKSHLSLQSKANRYQRTKGFFFFFSKRFYYSPTYVFFNTVFVSNGNWNDEQMKPIAFTKWNQT